MSRKRDLGILPIPPNDSSAGANLGNMSYKWILTTFRVV
jgi:hypothetical protein